MKQTVRTFVAIPASADVRAAAGKLIEQLRSASVDVKWVEPENLHVTVKFLGDVALKETARVCEAVQRAAAEVEPFDLTFGGVGAFPNPARPRTIWLGTTGDETSLLALHASVEKRLQKLGFRREARRFHAHLTLGRVRQFGPGLGQLSELLRQHAQTEAGRQSVCELVVFSSELTPSGPTYAPLGRAPLGAGQTG
ncbi:MAG: RNA 2',3'-cyclic phosphodiesterase [Pirellulales bacterium]|nr:RNA 2',3'-cyclic phosphodiesterase [Pirellulales bacterium]